MYFFMSNMRNPSHPGEVLCEYLPEGVWIGEIAKRPGVTRQALSALLNGRAGVSGRGIPNRFATLSRGGRQRQFTGDGFGNLHVPSRISLRGWYMRTV